MRRVAVLVGLFAVCVLVTAHGARPEDSAASWHFAVSGDSRNCGDVVMPAIAADAKKHSVEFYWQLGDLRKTSTPDEDFIEENVRAGHPTNLAEYERGEWDDFVANQIAPWEDVPYFLGIGNHEVIAPKDREAFVRKFRVYLDRPELRAQRLKDDRNAQEPKTYYHWVRGAIDFIYLDNATGDQFDSAQMKWFRAVLERDGKDNAIRTLVVGMHKALPESISFSHSMNESRAGTESGREVYQLLLTIQNDAHKNVYLLASHSHYFMEGTFNTPYWKSHGGVLPGWIIGTAGAQRYPLPPEAVDAKAAKTNVYGYLLATVNPSGAPASTITFKFEELKESQVPGDAVERFTKMFVHQCFAGNRRTGPID
jgi:hypothetical protein